MNQRKTSARYYLFEDVLWDLPSFVHLKRPIAVVDLQAYAALVWKAEGGRGPCPVVRARHTKKAASYFVGSWTGPGTIALHAKHQNLGGLLHELAHALGPNDKLTHGPAFRKRCLRLYQVYGGWSGTFDG